MRALLAGELTQAQSYASDYHIKLEVQNGSGTWIDVGAALGRKWIVNASWGESVESKVMQVTFTLVQEMGGTSLSPLMTASALNRDDFAAYAPLLNVGRLVRASVATMPHLTALDVAKYRRFLDGRIDNVTQADSLEGVGPITLLCSDLGGWLVDLQVETSGIQYGTTPIGTALETVLQNLLTANIPATEPAVTLYKQSTSSFAVTEWAQGDTKLMEGLSTLVLDSTGEDIRYRYDAAHASRLTWFNPDRTRATVDATFAPGYTLRQLDLALANIRNAGEMLYAGGKVSSTSAASILNYRRRFFRLPASAMLTTAAQAQTVIDAVVNDLSAPPGEAVADLPFFWPVQLYDRYTFQANGRQFDTDQTFAVMGYQHTIEHGQGSTTLTLTSRIVGAFAEWLKRLRLASVPSLLDFDWSDSTTERTFTWRRSAATEAVWVYDVLVAVGGGSGWPVSGALPTGSPAVLVVGVDSYVATIPPAGYQRFVQFEPRTDRGTPGDLRRSVIDAAPVGLMYNQCIALITAATATVITVTVTASATVGSPTVQLVGVTGSAVLLSGPAIGVAAASGQVWTFTRGAALGGSGQAQFRAVFTGNIDDDDLVELPEQQRDTVYAQCAAAITGSTATVETVTVTASALSGSPTVQLVAVTGSAVLLSGPAIGVASPSGTVWTFTRGAALGGDGQAQFRAVLAGYQSDDDFAEIPEQGRDTVPLAIRARVTATTPTTVTVRVAMADPFPQGAASGTIAYQDLGSGGVTPASGGTVTPAATLTEAAGTYIDYVITRAAFGVGAGRVTFTGTAAGRVSDSDAVDVPEADRDTVPLASRARVTATTATTVTVRYAVADPYPQGANTATITYQDLGSGGVTPASGATVTPAATITEVAGSYDTYVITRPAFGSGPARVTFTATAAGRVSDSDAVDVPAQERDTAPLAMRILRVSESATQVVVRVEVISPNAGATVTVAYANGGLTVTPSSGGTLTSTTSFGTTAHIDYTITRDVSGGTPRRVTFTASASGYVDASDGVDVPAQDPAGSSITAAIDTLYASTWSGTTVTVAWTISGALSTGHYAINMCRTPSGTDRDLANGILYFATSTSLSHVMTTPDAISATLPYNLMYSFRIDVCDASNNVLRSSSWFDFKTHTP